MNGKNVWTRLLCVAIAFALAGGPAIGQEAKPPLPPPPKPLPARASCLVKIYFQPALFDVEVYQILDLLNALIQSTPVTGPAAAEVRRQNRPSPKSMPIKVQRALGLDRPLRFEVGLKIVGFSGAARAAAGRKAPVGVPSVGRRGSGMFNPGVAGRRIAGTARRPPAVRGGTGTGGRGSPGRQVVPSGRGPSEFSVTAKVELRLEKGTDKVAAALLEAVCERLEAVLDDWNKKEVKRLEDRLGLLRKGSLSTREGIEALRKERQKLAGLERLSLEGANERLTQLMETMRELSLETSGKQARIAALREKIAKVRAQASEDIKKDPALAELKKIVVLRGKRLESLMRGVEKGVVAEPEIDQFQEEIAEAKLAVAQRRDEISRGAGGQLLEKLNAELATLEIDMAEMTARLQKVGKQSALMTGRLSRAEKLRPIQRELDLLVQSRAELLARREDLRRYIATAGRVTVIVIGGKDDRPRPPARARTRVRPG